MALRHGAVSRRGLLTGALVLPLAACAKPEVRTTVAANAAPSPSPSVDAAERSHFAALERKYDARLGVYAMALGSGLSVAYRPDERFAFCSTFKGLAAAAVLHQHPLSHLDKIVRYAAADINSFSPVTERHIGTGMTIRQLCDAAIRYSDGTAANLLVRDIGGPEKLTAYFRGLGDTVSRMDQYEPQLNRNTHADPRDATTPRALADDYRKVALGTALPGNKRSLLKNWLRHNTTGAKSIRAGIPHGWTVADKTGNGDYGRINDVAIVWPPHTKPLVIAVMSDRKGYDTPPRQPILAAATSYVLTALHLATPSLHPSSTP